MLVLAICEWIIEASQNAESRASEGCELQQIPCIYYFTQFGEFFIKVLIDLGSNWILQKK